MTTALVVLGAGLVLWGLRGRTPATPERKPAVVQGHLESDLAPAPGRAVSSDERHAKGTGAHGSSPASAPKRTRKALLERTELEVRRALDLLLASEDSVDRRVEGILAYIESADRNQRNAASRIMREHGDVALKLMPKAIATASGKALPWVAKTASRMGSRQLVRPLVERATREGAGAGVAVFRAIGSLGGEEARDFARARLASSSPRVGRLAWECFSLCAREHDLDFAFAKIGKGTAQEQYWAARVLARLCVLPHLRSPIARRLEAELDGAQVSRSRFIRAVTAMPPDAVEPILAGLADDPDPRVRVMAVRSLSRDARTIDRVVSILDGETDRHVLLSAVNGLTEHPRFEAVPRLLHLFRNGPGALKRPVHEALIATFGIDQGRHPAAWNAWIANGKGEGDRRRRNVFDMRQQRRNRDRAEALMSELSE
jgi:hypothetical protein